MTDHRTEAARLLAPAAPDPIDVVVRLLAQAKDLREALEIVKEDRAKWVRVAAERSTERHAIRKALEDLTAVKAERDALAAKVREIEAWDREARDALVDIADDLHVSTIGVTSRDVATRCGVEIERRKMHAAKLEARPVLTVERLDVAMAMGPGAAAHVMAKLGAVTLPAQDRAEELIAAYVDEYAARYEAAGNPPHMDRWAEVSADRRRLSVETMTAALAKLGAPATTPVATGGPVAAVSVDELADLLSGILGAVADGSTRAGIRAVVARLGAALVTAEELAIEIIGKHRDEIGTTEWRSMLGRVNAALAIIAARKAGGQ